MPERPACYGNLLPNLETLTGNRPCQGTALSVTVRSAGIGVQSREVNVDLDAWDNCQQCPSYRSCYDLSLAQTVLRIGLRSI